MEAYEFKLFIQKSACYLLQRETSNNRENPLNTDRVLTRQTSTNKTNKGPVNMYSGFNPNLSFAVVAYGKTNT